MNFLAIANRRSAEVIWCTETGSQHRLLYTLKYTLKSHLVVGPHNHPCSLVDKMEACHLVDKQLTIYVFIPIFAVNKSQWSLRIRPRVEKKCVHRHNRVNTGGKIYASHIVSYTMMVDVCI